MAWLVAAAAFAPSAVAADEVTKTLAPAYKALNDAIKRNDVKAMAAWVAKYASKDFKYVSAGKQSFTRDQFLSGMRQQAASTQKVLTSTYKITGATVRNNAATVSVSSTFVGMVKLVDRPNKLANESVTTDLWVRGTDGWKLKSIVGVKETVSIDGKKLGSG